VASGGGAKTHLWLKIKASCYGIPILVPSEPECGVIGCAAMVAAASGRFRTAQDARGNFRALQGGGDPRSALVRDVFQHAAGIREALLE